MDNFAKRRAAGPKVTRVLDTAALVVLEREAHDYNFSQRLPENWIRDNVADTGAHAARVAVEVEAEEFRSRPLHWRLLVLLTMRDGRQALSLLDATPESFLKNSSSARDDEKRTIETGLSGAMSVADWEKSSLG